MPNYYSTPENLLAAREKLHLFQMENKEIVNAINKSNGKLIEFESPNALRLVHLYFTLVAQVEHLTRQSSKALISK